jgi:hypothetical protein
VGVSTDVLAQALPVTEFIHGEPEPVVVGPLQPLPFLTVNELVPLDQSMPPDLKVQASPEVREKSRQHFDFLLNICRPESSSMVAPSPFQLPESPETGFCVNCQNGGPCWGLCWFDNSCTTEGHLFPPMDSSGPLVDDPTMLNWMAKLAAFHLPHDLFPMEGCIHLDYMVDAYVAVLAPVTCQAWLEYAVLGRAPVMWLRIVQKNIVTPLGSHQEKMQSNLSLCWSLLSWLPCVVIVHLGMTDVNYKYNRSHLHNVYLISSQTW